jgi:hypothetical protein
MPATFQVLNRRGSSHCRIAFVACWSLLRLTVTAHSQEVLKSVNFTSDHHLTAKSIAAVQTITGVSLNATQLANRLVGPGLTLISATVVVGNEAQFGTFTDGEATVGMGSGIVLSTGNVIDVKGSCRDVAKCGTFRRFSHRSLAIAQPQARIDLQVEQANSMGRDTHHCKSTSNLTLSWWMRRFWK